MTEIPIFHHHQFEHKSPRATHITVEEQPLGGVFQTYCPICRKWGFVSSQLDRDNLGFRLLGQGHSRASRIFNGLPIYGVLLTKRNNRFFYEDENSYVKVLYETGERVLRANNLYDEFAVVPIFRDDFPIIDRINETSERERMIVYAMAIATLYVGVSMDDFQKRVVNHLHRLVVGFHDPIATIPRINLAGRVL